LGDAKEILEMHAAEITEAPFQLSKEFAETLGSLVDALPCDLGELISDYLDGSLENDSNVTLADAGDVQRNLQVSGMYSEFDSVTRVSEALLSAITSRIIKSIRKVGKRSFSIKSRQDKKGEQVAELNTPRDFFVRSGW
jgi:hypothetical protein